MSLVFSDSTNKSGIVDLIYSNTGADILKYPLKEVVRDVNLSIDKFMSIALQASGSWQLDDSGHSKDPIITTNLVSGQRDYHFTVDEQSNLILDIYRVMVKNADGIYYDLERKDQQDDSDWATLGFVDGQNKTGNPTKYDKTANGIFLDLIPNYNLTDGLKILYNREANYFTTADTTKKPGFAGLFHEYFALRPSYQYACRKGLKNEQGLREQVLLMEQEIDKYYGQRIKDERPIIQPKSFLFR